MWRIRFHGRGGQGVKTAARILGSAFFHEGFEVQDAPRYGAERRGAPLFAIVRADRAPIAERGAIVRADVVAVVDETLLELPAAAVLAGADEATLFLIATAEPARWKERLGIAGPVLALPLPSHGAASPSPRAGEVKSGGSPHEISTAAAGAIARLVGAISRDALARAVADEVAGAEAVASSLAAALGAYDRMAAHAGIVVDRADAPPPVRTVPRWVELSAEPVTVAAPAVHAVANSDAVATGLWRTSRPVIDPARCRHCVWICATHCPDAAIDVGANGEPSIDLEHCKGCLVCAALCPHHAIDVVAEPRSTP